METSVQKTSSVMSYGVYCELWEVSLHQCTELLVSSLEQGLTQVATHIQILAHSNRLRRCLITWEVEGFGGERPHV
jgi:hypothetical protein